MFDIYFLGAGKPFTGKEHAALKSIDNSSNVLDWSLKALNQTDSKCYFVCGYKADEIKASRPDLNYIENKEWKSTKAGWSLLKSIEGKPKNIIASYSDIVFRESAVKRILQKNGDVVIAVDSQWHSRYEGRSIDGIHNCERVCITRDSVNLLGSEININEANAEFIGLAYFSKKAIAELNKLKNDDVTQNKELQKTKLSDLVELLRIRGMKIDYVDLLGDWAQLNEEQDLAKFVLGTKAQTLGRLKKMLKLSCIEDQVSFTIKEWSSEPNNIIKNIQDNLGKIPLIIRSSALSEDGFASSSAGAYESVLNIKGNSKKDIAEGIKKVIDSYPDDNNANEVLVQPMLKNVSVSGVVFTRGLQDGSPYYTINYDDQSGSTESITSGSSQNDKKLIVRRDINSDSKAIPSNLGNLLQAIQEIEKLLSYGSLDIEFAITKEFGIHILQVRPIAVKHNINNNADTKLLKILNEAEKKFEKLQKSTPFVLGDKAFFGVMPDWNPAEIIGTKPNAMAESLYKYLILDDIWAKQRQEYGYRDVRPKSLLVNFAGHPYIDIRASFNSFIPNKLPERLAKKLVNFSLGWLENHPELHDKVEFDVIPTCYDLDFDRWEKKLLSHASFTESDVNILRNCLLDITNKAIKRENIDIESIHILERRLNKIKNSKLDSLQKAIILLDDAKFYGTLPFSHLARSAFVAISLLRSGVARGLLGKREFDDFLNSIHTVSKDFADDSRICSENNISWKDFVEKYGHLRPGTYDISSPSYRSDPETYLKPVIDQAKNRKETKNQNDKKYWKKISKSFFKALNDAGINGSPEQLEEFLVQAIEGREYAKFAFTKNLSLALDEIKKWGKTIGVSSEDLSHLNIEDLKTLSNETVSNLNLQEWIATRVSENKNYRNITKPIELPPLITNKNDFSVFLYPESQPNFIGSAKITEACINLEGGKGPEEAVEGKIVLIPQADPGYDWLFGRNIAGLITMYGGANSHMAIRSAEFGLPAAIGIGPTLYRSLSKESKLELNPGERIIRTLS